MLHDFEKSVSEVFGKKVIDLSGYVSSEFGEDTLVFKITRILFEDGTSLWVEGEHDTAYIPNNADIQERLKKYYVE